MTTAQATAAAFKAGQKRREAFLDQVRAGVPPNDACKMIGVSIHTYRSWRQRFRDFAAMVDSVRSDIDIEKLGTAQEWKMGFAKFRSTFFGNDSPWFHLRIIDALESATPGSVTLITIPPEHGKTTTLEDYCNYKLAVDPEQRITVGSEGMKHSMKVLRRVRNRMDEESGNREYRYRFGPFRAPKGDPRRLVQPWSATHFDVYRRGTFDERDYSMAALGMGSAIAGTRTDLLLVDDPQSQKSLNQTKALFETFRQDWLSRPGSKGTTVVLMTRQGEDDFAQVLMDSEILDHHIVIPAWSEEHGWLWPERYTEAEYAIMRRNAGEEAWERNYMQRPRPASTIIFDKTTIAKGRNPLRRFHTPPPQGTNIQISVDPGFNVTGFTVATIDTPKFEIYEARKVRKLAGTEAIIALVEDALANFTALGSHISYVVLETKAFQRGLATDARLEDLQRRYGFVIVPHETGMNKYDRDLGVPQMVHSLLREEIEWSWGDDLAREIHADLEDDMYRWRPGIKGARLEQDALMSTWFAWLHWRKYRNTATLDRTQWDFNAAQFNSPIIDRLARTR